MCNLYVFNMLMHSLIQFLYFWENLHEIFLSNIVIEVRMSDFAAVVTSAMSRASPMPH